MCIRNSPQIFYEDPYFLIVDKPPGLHTAPLGNDSSETLVGWVLAQYPNLALVRGRKDCEPGLIHRLDCGTSGLVLFCKTQSALDALLLAEKDQAILKEYQAICASGPARLCPEGWTLKNWCRYLPAAEPSIAEYNVATRFAPAGRNQSRVVPVSAETLRFKKKKTAPKTYRTVFKIAIKNESCFYLTIHIRCGFRHQIRSHLSFCGLPIAGDPLYGVHRQQEVQNPIGQGMALYSTGIYFRHPFFQTDFYVQKRVF